MQLPNFFSAILVILRFALGLTVFAAIGAAWVAHYRSEWFVDLDHQLKASFRDRAVWSAIASGFGICTFLGIESALWFVPDGWGYADEDGGWVPFIYTVATFGAFLGGFGGAGMVERYSFLKCRNEQLESLNVWLDKLLGNALLQNEDRLKELKNLDMSQGRSLHEVETSRLKLRLTEEFIRRDTRLHEQWKQEKRNERERKYNHVPKG